MTVHDPTTSGRAAAKPAPPGAAGPGTGAATLGAMILRAGTMYDGAAMRYRLDGDWAEVSYAELSSCGA